MRLIDKYDAEQAEIKAKIAELEKVSEKENDIIYSKNQFIRAVRKFMEMKTLTPTIIHELIDKIEVYQAQGSGKNKTQKKKQLKLLQKQKSVQFRTEHSKWSR